MKKNCASIQNNLVVILFSIAFFAGILFFSHLFLGCIDISAWKENIGLFTEVFMAVGCGLIGAGGSFAARFLVKKEQYVAYSITYLMISLCASAYLYCRRFDSVSISFLDAAFSSAGGVVHLLLLRWILYRFPQKKKIADNCD